MPAAPAATAARRTYVLDTNVLLHDPVALFQFEEHDVGIPLIVLEELDKHKKGVADLARNARQVTRTLGEVLAQKGNEELYTGFSLASASGGKCTGRLYFLQSPTGKSAPYSQSAGLIQDKPDNLILASVQQLRAEAKNAILVTKDINLRVKALALNVPAEDYRSDRVLDDADMLPTGYIKVDESFWTETEATAGASKNGRTMRTKKELPVNSFVLEATSRKERLWRVGGKDSEGQTKLTIVKSEGVNSQLSARSPEQSMALELLHDTDVDFVALLGKAGSGKTLLALAAGIDQVDNGIYDKVMITRATVPLGDDIGFLPGTEEQKMAAWLGGTVEDCFASLGKNGLPEALKAKVEIPSMTFMRGRSFQQQFIIIDEAQNLTQKQMRALITRSGNGTKVIVTGNLAQIDTPYLDAGSSGLAWAVKLLNGWAHGGSLILPRGERSRLASYVEDHANGGADTPTGT